VDRISYDIPHYAIFSILSLLSLSPSILLSILFPNIHSIDFHFWLHIFTPEVHGGKILAISEGRSLYIKDMIIKYDLRNMML
jgi:hypothetical protein